MLIDAIDHVNILDPACGSGAFPMGILHKLVFILGKLDPHNEQWKERQIEPMRAAIRAALAIPQTNIRARAVEELEEQIAAIEQAFAHNELDYGRKLYLIENCIYGVDIQPVAVQIAKLRFFISLVVDQRLNDHAPNRGILPLPNLETKFVAANTLLGIEKPKQLALRNPDITAKEKELAEVRSKHFRARTPQTKEKWRLEDKRLRGEISALLQKDGFPNETTTKLAHWDPYNQNASADFFEMEWMFGLEDGFDVVIGNPPYVRQEKIKELKPALQKQYTCYTSGLIYTSTSLKGLPLARERGVLCYICSNKYFRAGYGKKLRGYLSKQATIRQLIDFGDAPVFTAIAYPSIVLLQKQAPNDNRLTAFNWEPGPPVTEFEPVFAANKFKMPQSALTADGWRLEQREVLALLAKLRSAGTPLGEYVQGRFYRGILTGLNEAFVVDRATRDRLIAEHPSSAELLKPYLRGQDIKKWQPGFDDQYLIRIESSANKKHPWSNKSEEEAERIFAETYPAIYAFFQPLRSKLINRFDQGQYFWELRACAYWGEFSHTKIIYQEIATYQAFAFDDSGFHSNNKTFLIPEASKVLIALLNSKVVWFFLDKITSKLQGGAYAMQMPYVSQIPIPLANNKRHIELR
ncbi:MAG: Eco57I restriction-modification methylase domain-containing protein [Chloroflexi bacterium]|nr:Eco57I restriction-modification methylase domain-containing protein [Chloroflexota bacterium]